MFRKVYRKVFFFFDIFRSFVLKTHYKIMYRDIHFIGSVYLGKKVKLVCTDGSRLILKDCHISDFTHINADNGGVIEINKTFIGSGCVIASHQNITIKENCAIAENVVIRDQNHRYDLSDTLIAHQGYDTAPILIEENVWIGAKATILKGVFIGKNAVIGAMSLVNRDVAESTVAFGIPAKPTCVKNS